MPHFLVSWDRAIVQLCPKSLEKILNEDGKEETDLDAEMSYRNIENLPLPQLSPELASLDREDIQDLTPQEIEVIEATFCISDAAESPGSGLTWSEATITFRRPSPLEPRPTREYGNRSPSNGGMNC